MTIVDAVILLVLAVIPLELTVAMFLSRQMMLGLPSGLFWAVLGGYAYTQSTTPWGDWQYFLFFASMGMVMFCALAAYGLRERKDVDAEGDEAEGHELDKDFYGEGKGKKPPEDGVDGVGRRSQGLRNRAAQRREKVL